MSPQAPPDIATAFNEVCELYKSLQRSFEQLRAQHEKLLRVRGPAVQEPHMSFNLQNLQLHQKMQQENRRFNTLSNIMKTKHDTVKNSINNVR